MEEKFGICVFCKNKDIGRKIFPILDSDKDTVICPFCGHTYKINEAINHFNSYIDFLLKKAKKTLIVKGEYEKAYCDYAHVLRLSEENDIALAGRIISLTKLSTVRESKYFDVIDLLNYALKVMFANKNYSTLLSLLFWLYKSSVDYLNKILKALALNSVFYSYDCLYLFVTRINEINSFNNNIIEYLKKIQVKYKEEECLSIIDRINMMIRENTNKMYSDFTISDGSIFRIRHYYPNKKSFDFMMIKKPSSENIISLEKMKTLEENHPYYKTIEDSIYKNNKSIVTLIYLSFIFTFIFGLSTFVFLCFFLIGILAKELTLILFIVFGVLTIFTLISFFIFKRNYKKKILLFNTFK